MRIIHIIRSYCQCEALCSSGMMMMVIVWLFSAEAICLKDARQDVNFPALTTYFPEVTQRCYTSRSPLEGNQVLMDLSLSFKLFFVENEDLLLIVVPVNNLYLFLYLFIVFFCFGFFFILYHSYGSFTGFRCFLRNDLGSDVNLASKSFNVCFWADHNNLLQISAVSIPTWATSPPTVLKRYYMCKFLTCKLSSWKNGWGKKNLPHKLNRSQLNGLFNPMFTATCKNCCFVACCLHVSGARFQRGQKEGGHEVLSDRGHLAGGVVTPLTRETYQCPLWHHKVFVCLFVLDHIDFSHFCGFQKRQILFFRKVYVNFV